MFPPFWYYLNNDTKETNYIFKLFGKSLYIATRYESYCKGIRTLLDIKNRVRNKKLQLSDEEEVNLIVSNIYKKNLHNHIDSISKSLNSDNILYNILIEAKIERNFIAHELALGFEQNIDNDVSIYNTMIETLKTSVKKILNAEMIILNINAYMTHEEPPPKNYINNNYSWIFSDKDKSNVT